MQLRVPRFKPWQWALLIVAVLGVAAAGVWGLRHLPVREIIETVKIWGPVPFFVVAAAAPAFGAPVTAFYLAAGATFPFGTAVVGSLLAMLGNVSFSYALARWIVRPVIEKLARRMGYAIPTVRKEDRWIITLLLRITPGPPFFMQHYLLALGGVPFGIYLAVSAVVAGVFAVGFVAVGAGLTSGSTVNIIAGVGVLVAVIVGVRFLRRTLQRRAHMHIGPHREVEADAGETPAGS